MYVVPCHGEELLKLGFSRNPLQRLQALHARYFDFFDLDRAFLIETDRVKDARRIERLLAGRIQVHGAPAPLLVPRSAAGHTEWYRGAYTTLQEAAANLGSGQGYRVHAPLRVWLHAELERQRHLLFDWSRHQPEALAYATLLAPGGAEAVTIERVLRNALDAHVAMGGAIGTWVPATVAAWHARGRG